jgi:hypothetical protein
MPDGAYYLKVVVSDSPSNPASQALTGERSSDRFVVVNTPPRIESLRAATHSSEAVGATISFDAISSSATIARAQYSLDAGDWQMVFPTGLLSDAPKESYEISISNVSPGEHTVAVQVFDRFENSTAAKVTFTAPKSSGKK